MSPKHAGWRHSDRQNIWEVASESRLSSAARRVVAASLSPHTACGGHGLLL